MPRPFLKGRNRLRWVAGLLVVLVSIPIVGIIYQIEASKRDANAFPAPGKMVDVGGFRLHIYCTGQRISGSPTVVFEGGLGAASIMWSMVQQGVSTHTRACSYDRAGYGWSDSAPTPRTALQIVNELHVLLDRAGEQQPYILVGHSFGGIIVRLYASKYTAEVAGLVLVDARQEDFFERMPPAFLQVDEANFRNAKILAIVTPFGLTRLAGNLGLLDSSERYLAPMPDKLQDTAKAIMFYNARHWETSVAEREAINQSFDEVRTTHLPPALPLIVLTAANGVEAWQPTGSTIDQATRATWMDLQRELARLTTHSEWVVVENSGHYIQLDRPESVIDAILKEIP